MIDTSILDPIAIFLLNATIKTTLFMGLVLFAVWLLGTRQAAKRSLLLSWCLVGVLVIPIASLCMPSLRFQFDSPAPPSEPAVPTVQPVVMPDTPLAKSTPKLQQQRMSDRAFSENSDLSQDFVSPSPTQIVFAKNAGTKSIDWTTHILNKITSAQALYGVMAVYAIGVLILLIRLIYSLIMVCSFRRSLLPCEDEQLQHDLQVLKKQLGIRRSVALSISDKISSPTQVGLLKPVIVLPTPIVKSRDQLESILIHELIHVKRWDCLYRLLAMVGMAFYWFNPLFHHIKHLLFEVQEQACDDWTVTTTGNSESYADTLLNVATQLQSRPAMALGMDMARTPQVMDRVNRIITLGGHVSPRVGRVSALVMAVVFIGGATAIGSLTVTTDQTTNDQTQTTIDYNVFEGEDVAERAMSQDQKIEITGQPQEQKPAKPSKSKISGTIHLNGQTIPDSFLVGVTPQLSAKWSPVTRRPENAQTIYDRDFAFDLDPGLYTLVVSAFGYEILETAILVPDADTQIEVKAYLEPFGLKKKDDIEWVKLWGEFCRWRIKSSEIVELVKRDSVWVLPGENPVKEGEGYRFIVHKNDSNVYNLRHSNAKQKSSKLIGFSSIYTGGEIIFDPSVYASPKRDSRTEFAADNELQTTFSSLVKDMKDIHKEGMFSYFKMLRSADVWDSTYIDQGNRFREIVNQYPPYFEQFLLQEEFEFLQRFHPHNRVMRELRKLRSEKKDYETKIKQHYQSAIYESYFTQIVRLAKKIDPNSIFFKTHDTFAFLELDEGLHFAPHLGKKYNIPPFYFTGILVAHERNLPPGTKEGESLLWRMAQHYRDRDHPVAARSAIDQLVQRYPNSKTVLKGTTEKLLNALDMREDRVAPDFVVKTVAGDSLRLSDFRGKFVMLDFWATWCAPCLNELPHLRKLSQSFSEELKVIGLAHDHPRSLEDFLKEQEHKIPYPNGVSAPKIEKAYGIVSWPTNFLIAPNGKIIAKNLRGEKLVDLVAEKLTAYKSQ